MDSERNPTNPNEGEDKVGRYCPSGFTEPTGRVVLVSESGEVLSPEESEEVPSERGSLVLNFFDN